MSFSRRIVIAALSSCLVTFGCAPVSFDADPGAESGMTTRAVVAAVPIDRRVNDDVTARNQNEPTLAWSPAVPNNLIVGSHDYPESAVAPIGGEVYAWASFDCGQTFGAGAPLPGLTVSSSGQFEGASDPQLACDGDGFCYFATFVYTLSLEHTAIAINRTRDGGRSWEPPVLVDVSDTQSLFVNRAAIAVDTSHGPRRGTVYVASLHVELDEGGAATSASIFISASTDQGQIWSAPARVSPEGLSFNQTPRIVIDREGLLHVVYENFLLDDPERDQHVIQSSSDGAATFSSPVRVSYVWDTFDPLPPGTWRNNSWPKIAADPVSGALHVVWSDSRSGAADILAVSSLDHGQSWTDAVRVNDTPEGALIEQAFPAVACGPQGYCGVSYASGRRSPGSGWLDTYFTPIRATRARGSVTTLTGSDRRVSSASFDPNVGFDGTFFGEYSGLVIDWTAAHPAWTDSRLSQTNEAGMQVLQQDIFTASLPIPLRREAEGAGSEREAVERAVHGD